MSRMNKLTVNVNAAWEHVYEGNEDNLTANLGTGNNFTVYGPNTGQMGRIWVVG